MKRFATAAALAVLVVRPECSAAEGPATIRGTVYFCGETRSAPHAVVLLRNLTTGEKIPLMADERGRFVRVGLLPGRYLIAAQRAERVNDREKVSRLARLEADDVVDLRIGISPNVNIGGTYAGNPWAERPDEPHPLCDPPLVPAAASPFDRYVVH